MFEKPSPTTDRAAVRPNILLIMTDQQRGDCLGIDGHPCLMTPTLDALAAGGARFSHAYSTCPSCIPARRSLLSGQFPATHGMVGYEENVPWHPDHTLPGELRAAGYHTALVGRPMHQHPSRKRFGYDHMVHVDDHAHHLPHHALPHMPAAPDGHGLSANGWTARPWHLDETEHPTYRTADEALRFLDTWRDPAAPFFLTVSFIAPHPPLCPPGFYMDRYLRLDTPAAEIGDWAQPPTQGERGFAVDSDRVHLTGEALKSTRAAYYGLINHVDDQICRILQGLTAAIDPLTGCRAIDNTIIAFTSDHGEMLGDHYLFRKTYPYEASSRVPLIFRLPQGMCTEATNSGRVIHEAACLEDIMPTLLDLSGTPIPDGVDGRSLAPLLRDENPNWREYLHGEHATCYGTHQANHYLTDGREKYIWYTQSGLEQLFDLDADPNECHDLIASPAHANNVARWRERMIAELSGRPEGFTDGETLIAGRAYPSLL